MPRTKKDCEFYLRQPSESRDDLITAVCFLNLKKNSETQKAAAELPDTCLGGIIKYDLAMDDPDKPISKGDRFSKLQSLLDCSTSPDYVRMIEVRAKLAHYE